MVDFLGISIIVSVVCSNVVAYLIGSRCTKIKTPCCEVDREVKD